MKNSKGFTIPVVASMVVLFVGLGYGALNYSGMQGQSAASQALSTQGFWAADAGVERAVTALLTYTWNVGDSHTLPLDTTLVSSAYNTTITLPVGKPWTVASTGYPTSNTSATRNLYAQIGYKGLINAISTTGQVTVNGNNDNQQPITGSIAQHVLPVFFYDIFNPLHLAEADGSPSAEAIAKAYSPSTFHDCTANPPVNCDANGVNVSIPEGLVNQLVYVKLQPNQTVSLNGGWTGSNFLIVDGGTLDMSGGANQPVNFRGIIWVENGEFTSIGGGVGIDGTVYINGSASLNTSINGASVDLVFNQPVIQSVFDQYGITSHQPGIVCWSEIPGVCN